MKTKRTKACVVEALFRTSFCTKTSTRFCTECGLALTAEMMIVLTMRLFCSCYLFCVVVTKYDCRLRTFDMQLKGVRQT